MVSNLATATLVVSLLASTPQPVEWQQDYGEALAETRGDDQPLLVVLDSPTEHAQLEPELMGEGEQAADQAELLQAYRLCHVDVSTDYGKKVARAFEADDFPYTAIIDRTGSVVIFSKEGQIAADEWENVLTKYRDGERAGTSRTTSRVSYKVSGDDPYSSSTPTYRSPNYCPSCQRRPM